MPAEDLTSRDSLPLAVDGCHVAAAAATPESWQDGLALSDEVFWACDAQGRVTRLAGRHSASGVWADMTGKPLWAVSAQGGQTGHVSPLGQAMQSRAPFEGVALLCHSPDGVTQWWQFSGRAQWDAQGVWLGHMGVARDVTQLKRTEQTVEHHKALVINLSSRVPGMLFQLHRNSRGWFSFPFASDAMMDLFQLDPAQARHDAAPVFARLLPVDFVKCRAALESSARTLTPWVQTYRVQWPDGRVVWHASNAVPYSDGDGGVTWYGFASDATERVDTEAQLQRAHEQLHARTHLMDATLESLSQGVMMLSEQGRVTYYNQRLLALLELPDALLARQPMFEQVIDWQREMGHFGTDADRVNLSEWYRRDGDGKLWFAPQYNHTRLNSTVLEVRSQPMPDGGWVRTFADVTAHVRAGQALERSELHLRTLFDAIPDRVWLKDTQGVFVMCNAAAAQGYGRAVQDIVGRTEPDLEADPVLVGSYRHTDMRALQSHAPVTYEQALPRAGDSTDPLTFEVVKRAVLGPDGQALGVLGLARDVSERKQAEAHIERLAFYDPLTGLCNRRLFHDRLEQAQAACTRSGHWAAVCFIDLDNFKDLNDTQGHDQGDLLLQQVGKRLLGAVRDQDTVARLGGDEFVVLLEALGQDEAQAAMYANSVGEKLLQALNQPYALQRGEHHNTPSLGLTLFRDHAERVEDVLKRADLAMYQSKAAGRNTVRFFDPRMQAAVQRRSELARDLREALVRDELTLFSQPVVNEAGGVVGHEALLRWIHPQRGMVSPAEFIPVAEQTGLIVGIGNWVLHKACQHLAEWASDPARAHWTLAVNLSARQLRLPDFVQTVRDTLTATGARPSQLKLELTESLLLHDVEDTIAKMAELSRDGIRFSLDDFGTGYSSLSYLKRLPLSLLKIDQSFVRDLLTDANDAVIAHTILQLADSLGLDVVAEGVENEGQLQLLQVMGCQAFQGYLFGRPAPM
ncbi:MAG TPA: EAL domain-containing protein [Burkholderiaceae bacterium]|nr:EAL domain-containing protein [Burkholderiaceae bacterium]